MRLPEMLAAGVRAALATDGSGSDDTQRMFEARLVRERCLRAGRDGGRSVRRTWVPLGRRWADRHATA